MFLLNLIRIKVKLNKKALINEGFGPINNMYKVSRDKDIIFAYFFVKIGVKTKVISEENKAKCIPESAKIWLFPLFLARVVKSLSFDGV